MFGTKKLGDRKYAIVEENSDVIVHITGSPRDAVKNNRGDFDATGNIFCTTRKDAVVLAGILNQMRIQIPVLVPDSLEVIESDIKAETDAAIKAAIAAGTDTTTEVATDATTEEDPN